jgi:hypothetical protein
MRSIFDCHTKEALNEFLELCSRLTGLDSDKARSLALAAIAR